MNQINYQPIGLIHSPFKKIQNMPIQPSAALGVKGHIVVNEEFVEGLSDLDGFSHNIQEMEDVSNYKIGWLSNHKKDLKSRLSDKGFKT